MMLLVSTIKLTCALFLSSVFFLAALHKVRNKQLFLDSIRQYELISERLVLPFAHMLIILELIAGCALLIPTTISLGVLLSFSLFGLYLFAMAISLYRGLTLKDCGCSGMVSEQPLNSWLLLRNLVLMFLSLFVLSDFKVQTEAVLISIVMALFLQVFYISLDQVFHNRARLLNIGG